MSEKLDALVAKIAEHFPICVEIAEGRHLLTEPGAEPTQAEKIVRKFAADVVSSAWSTSAAQKRLLNGLEAGYGSANYAEDLLDREADQDVAWSIGRIVENGLKNDATCEVIAARIREHALDNLLAMSAPRSTSMIANHWTMARTRAWQQSVRGVVGW